MSSLDLSLQRRRRLLGLLHLRSYLAVIDANEHLTGLDSGPFPDQQLLNPPRKLAGDGHMITFDAPIGLYQAIRKAAVPNPAVEDKVTPSNNSNKQYDSNHLFSRKLHRLLTLLRTVVRFPLSPWLN